MRNRGGRAQLFPARRGSGGGGPTGEKREGHKSYLWRGLGLEMVACSGGSTEWGGRRRSGLARQRSGGDWEEKPGLGAALEVWEGGSGVQMGNGVV